ncbi:hypothetical protein CYCD_16270 [Tenuifilaceae bacterium CYCD]|nr:hypothetical protein CYCD_16270 [Tenuifilaceae bacterium CYCD]
MNKLIVAAILLMFSPTCKSQEIQSFDSKKFSLKTGAGYFNCLPAGSNGTTIWLEGSRRLSTDFEITLKLQHSQSYMTLDDSWGPWAGQKKPDVFYVVDLSFSRPLKIGNYQFLEIGIGILYERSYSWLPAVEYNNGNPYLNYNFESKMDDLGMSLKLDYHYRFNNGFILGCRAQTCYVTGMFEGLAITPILGFRF